MGTNDIHRHTEQVYKHLVENFNSGIKQLLLAGKAYHKALQGVSSSAHAYTDALGKLGLAARACRGGTEEIGEAILSIAEAQKILQARYEVSTKALFTEVVLPLEHKMDNEFKRVISGQRKYHQGHKALVGPYNKALESLKKFRKKTRNKYVYDNEKEAQYVRTLEKCQERLDDFRVAGLQSALVEERKCHCFLLNKLCDVSTLNLNIHKTGVDLYGALPEWRALCANPGTLPESAGLFLSPQQREDFGAMNGGQTFLSSNGYLHRDTQSLGGGFRRATSTHDVSRTSGRFDGTRTLPIRPSALPPAPPTDQLQVRAMYTHHGTGENQLSFEQGDIIHLMGEKSEGWQYGHNIKTGAFGWFPLSFTQVDGYGFERESPELHRALSQRQRVKSVGDLMDSNSLGENMYIEQEIPGNVRRPRSLYEGPFPSRPQSPGPHGNSAYSSPVRQRGPLSAPPPPPPLMTSRQTPPLPPEDYNGAPDASLYRRM